MPEHAFHVIVIGGGLGGLCLAQGLNKAGISVAVYERDRTPRERLQGYRISLDEHGSRALYACLPSHLYETFLATCGKPGKGLRIVTEQLKERSFFPLNATIEQDPLTRPKSVSRITLRQILLAGLDDIVHFDKTFMRYEAMPGGKITAFFEDDTNARGDILVAADGGNSRIRKQLLPHAQRVETDIDVIMGKVPFTEETRSLLLPDRLDGTTLVLAPQERAMFIALHEFPRSAATFPGTIGGNDESYQRQGGLLFDNTRDYLFWGLAASRKQFGLFGNPQSWVSQELEYVAQRMVQNWHPHLQQLVRMADPTTVAYSPIRTSIPLKPWLTTHITLIGDAIHSMTPAQGIGGDTALRDASLLCRQLVAVRKGEKPLLQAIHDYEAKMIRYGFNAVRASKQSLDSMIFPQK